MRNFILFICLIGWLALQGQTKDTVVLRFNEYLGYVKKYHPIAKQAELRLGMGQANLMKARGGFDPKIEVDYDQKKFKGTEYYDRLNATFKVPTWYGVELKGSFEQNEGEYLNPENTVPSDGLYSAGVSVAVGQGMWINDRMATLKKAKYFRSQSKADRDLLVNQILYDASLAYFAWLKAYKEALVYDSFLKNAKSRFKGVKSSAQAGEIAAIDTVEAKITVQTRALGREQANVRLMKKSLELSGFLWLNDGIPLELQSNVIPDTDLEGEIDITFEILGKPLNDFTVDNHPKLKSLGYKIDGLRVEKRLKANRLLPKIQVEYNFLTETPELMNSFETNQYKGGVSFQLPLFLRKERGDLKLAKFKLQEAQYEMDNTQVQVKNQILAVYNELESFESQNVLINDIVYNYNTLLSAEERKFNFGESSLFLVNSRESKLIDAELKKIEVRNKYFIAKAKLFKSLAVVPENL
tara:strand:- start:440 stop:1843 length:1404 start_codon:yes stop_codon:yes gene_type:complete